MKGADQTRPRVMMTGEGRWRGEETTKAADYMDDIVLGHLLPSSRYSFPSSFTSVYASGS